MGYAIIKTTRDRDEYVLYSSSSDTPVFLGTRAEVITELGGDVTTNRCPTCRQWSPRSTVLQMMEWADEYGSSTHLVGRWGDSEIRYGQHGLMRREDLARVVELLSECREDEVLAMLSPFEVTS
jgi:hypothetical protein